MKPGDPREVIVNEAANWPMDLILVGAYGHSGVRNWQIGSVAECAAKHARCSVEVVRKPRTVTPDCQDMEKMKKVFLLGIAVVVVVRTMWKIRMENESPTSGIG